MNNSSSRKHHIEILFPIILFSIFAVSAITVILFAARIYQHGVETARENYSARTSLSYVTEKIRRNDSLGSISTETWNGMETLVLKDPDNPGCETRIYLCDGVLRELYMKEKAHVLPESGTEILELADFRVEDLDGGLFRVTCSGEGGVVESALIAARSMEVK